MFTKNEHFNALVDTHISTTNKVLFHFSCVPHSEIILNSYKTSWVFHITDIWSFYPQYTSLCQSREVYVHHNATTYHWVHILENLVLGCFVYSCLSSDIRRRRCSVENDGIVTYYQRMVHRCYRSTLVTFVLLYCWLPYVANLPYKMIHTHNEAWSFSTYSKLGFEVPKNMAEVNIFHQLRKDYRRVLERQILSGDLDLETVAKDFPFPQLKTQA